MSTTIIVDNIEITQGLTEVTLTNIQEANPYIEIEYKNLEADIFVVQEANPYIEIIQKDSIIEFNSIALQGFDGAKGDKGDKGDPFLYSDLTPEQKTELAELVEVDNAQFSTDLLANYILNKD